MFRGGREVRGSAFPSEAAGCTLAKAWNVPFALSGKGRRVLPYYQRAFSMKEKIAPRCGRARFGLGALRNATVPVRNAIPATTNEGRCANTGLRWLWGTVTGIPCFSGRKEPFRARACLQTSYRSQISEAARHTKAAKTSASLS